MAFPKNSLKRLKTIKMFKPKYKVPNSGSPDPLKPIKVTLLACNNYDPFHNYAQNA